MFDPIMEVIKKENKLRTKFEKRSKKEHIASKNYWTPQKKSKYKKKGESNAY